MADQVRVAFQVPCETAFDYLVDPANRVQWQGTLRRVEDIEPLPPQAGTSWRDIGLAEVVSEMRLTAVERPVRWAEVGTSKGVRMDLALTFEETPGGCAVTADLDVVGEGAARWVVALARRAMRRAVRRDLERAAGILAGTVEPRTP